jgi:alanyl-tRNA synthetase
MERIYYNNPYLAKWETDVEEVIERDGKYYVTLAETTFYPEGGGQPSDKGTIDGIEIIDLIEEDGAIYHVLSAAPSDKKVICEIDWSRRFDHMQQHTGQHLLSAVFYNMYKGETSSFHLGEDYVSIDISLGEISTDMANTVESAVNEYIYKDLQVKTYIIQPDEVSKYPLRKLPPAEDSIRIVEIDSIDYSPCCGTHVTRTGELGIIKILKTEKYKGITRVYFKCGFRALFDFQNKNNIISALSKHFSAPESELPARAEVLFNELNNANKEIKDLREQLSHYEAMDIIKDSNEKVISKTFDSKSFVDVQLITKHILNEGDYLIIAASIPDKRLMFTHRGSFEVNCGKIFKEHLAQYNGKGGGSDKQAQAGFNSEEDLIRFCEFLKETVEK